MERFLKNNIYLIPPIMVVATFFSHLISFNYVLIGNILGYSILAVIPMIYIFWYTKKYCWFTKLSVIALLVMNITCIIGLFINYSKYIYIFDLIIISITVFLSLFLSINRKLK